MYINQKTISTAPNYSELSADILSGLVIRFAVYYNVAELFSLQPVLHIIHADLPDTVLHFPVSAKTRPGDVRRDEDIVHVPKWRIPGKRFRLEDIQRGAVGHNPISIIVPCHRVIGAGGLLTGYTGGLERKARLLRLEGIL